MNVSKVVLVEGKSQFSSLNLMLHDLCDSLRSAHIEVKVINIQHTLVPTSKDIESIKSWNPDLMISFCPYGLYYIEDQKKWLWEYFDCPYVCWVVDSVISYFIHLLPAVTSSSLIVACVDYDNYRWLQKYFPFLTSMYLPHAANLSSLDKEALSPREEMDISFLSSINSMEEVAVSQFKKDLSKEFYELLNVSVGLLKEAPSRFIWDVVVENFSAIVKRKFDFKEDIGNLLKIFFIVEQYLRTYKKVMLVDQLSQFKLDIFGNKHWESYGGNFNYRGHIDSKQLANVFVSSKLTLNSQPPQVISGMHERIFRAMLSGCVVVAEETMSLQENFSQGEDIVLFQPNNMEAACNDIKLLLGDKTKRDSMREKAKKNVLENHTMKNRIDTILAKLSDF